MNECVRKQIEECDFSRAEGNTKFQILTMFCGHDEMCWEVGNHEALQMAKDVMLRDYPILGLLEFFNETLMLYEQALPQFFKGIRKVRWAFTSKLD